MGARADRLDPHARMGVSNERVRLEAERVQRVPEPAIDELEEGELRRRQNAAPQPRLVQDRHEAWRRKMMLLHDVEGPGGDCRHCCVDYLGRELCPLPPEFVNLLG